MSTSAAGEVPPPLQNVLDRLEGVTNPGYLQYQANCPAHDDGKASLSVRWGDKGKVVLHCHANCEHNAVMKKLNLQHSDLEAKMRLTAVYDYKDEDGELSFQVERHENGTSKTFRQRRPHPTKKNKVIYNMDGVEPLPYNLPQLAEALATGEDVYIVEGEKDVEALWGGVGAVATCNHGGAGKWTDVHSQYFEGSESRVFIVADRDVPGYKHALKVYYSLQKIAGITAQVVLSAVGKDAADHISDHGLDEFIPVSREELIVLTREPDEDDEKLERAVADRAFELRVGELARQRIASERVALIAANDKRVRVMAGDEFTLDLPDEVPALWGNAESVLWMQDEALLLVGGDGVGKSTLAQQLVLAHIGLRDELLGYAVLPCAGRVLYLAMDRPGQIRRSFTRMVAPEDRPLLRERLVFWSGPLPIDPLSHATSMADWIAEQFGDDIDLVVVDSYKDLAPGLSEDKPGSQLNLAMQEVLARGIQWLGLHHQRKPAADRTADYTLADVYGSRWITAGAGSVFIVLGDAGDSTVELRHVKQPANVVGPLLVTHDHPRGVSTRRIANKTVRGALVAAEGERLTVRDLCEELYGEYNNKFGKRVRTDLKRLLEESNSGVHRVPGQRGGSEGSTPEEWYFEPSEQAKLQLKTQKPNPKSQPGPKPEED